MNRDRRKDLANITERLKALETPLGEILADLEAVKDEEEEAIENLPESMQEGEQGDRMQAAADSIQEAMDALDEMISSVEEVKGAIERAAE